MVGSAIAAVAGAAVAVACGDTSSVPLYGAPNYDAAYGGPPFDTGTYDAPMDAGDAASDASDARDASDDAPGDAREGG